MVVTGHPSVGDRVDGQSRQVHLLPLQRSSGVEAGQGQHVGQDRLEEMAVDQTGDLIEQGHVRLGGDERSAREVGPSLRLGRWAHEGSQNAARLEHLPRARLCLAAEGVEYGIDAAHDLFEALPGIVDELVRTQLAQETLVPGRAGRDHLRAPPPGELHGEGPDAARRPMDQHGLPL